MYSLGLDFGSTAVRALIADLENGKVVCSASCDYPCGIRGVCLDEKDPLLARQSPDAYITAMTSSIQNALADAKKSDKNFSAEKICGIGVDATSATIIPVTCDMTPLSRLEEMKDNLNAFSWMWKDHTSFAESREITSLAQQEHPEYLERCGGSYSSEWFWSKILHVLRCEKAVFDAAYAWIELCDFIPAVLAGINHYDEVCCSSCAAGHKAMYAEEWGGLPADSFLEKLDPQLVTLKKRLYRKTFAPGSPAGKLSSEWSKILDIPAGTPIATGIVDAHSGAVGSGVGAGKMVCIIGTSTCDITVAKFDKKVPAIKGISGIAKDSVIPGFYGIEGGHAAVGDSFYWQAATIGGTTDFSVLEQEASKLRPHLASPIAIDWLNGNRNPYANESLKGIMVGLTLHTTLPEMYRAWIEATAYGVRQVIDIMADAGFEISEIICGGGIPEKSPLLMQIYADILGRKLLLPASNETCALGAAFFGAVAGNAFSCVEEAQKKLCHFKEKCYVPVSENQDIYDQLYAKYCRIGREFATGSLAGVVE